MARTKEPADVRRAQLLEAAVIVCGEKGYHRTRIDDIAAQAGLSKGAVYHHFASKKALFIALCDDTFAGFTEAIEMAVDGPVPVVDVLRLIVLGSLELPNSDALSRTLFDLYVLGIREPEFRAAMRTQYQSLLAVSRRLFARGVATGELREVDVEAASSVFMMAIDGIFLMDMLLGEHDSLKKRLTAYVDLMIAGLVAGQEHTDRKEAS